jgi:predicted LPLAT superfamily acyltransferase
VTCVTHWTTQKERGNRALLRLMIWITRRLGWHAGRLLLPAITAWFYLRSAPARAASAEFLTRALDRPVTGRDVFRHIFTFASAILDRVFLLSGEIAKFDIRVEGLEHVEAVVAQGSGCVLLGAHLGSFEVLRHLAQRCPVPVKALMYRSNAGPLTRLLESLDPALASGIIQIGETASMLRVHEAVAGGAIAGILADRSPDTTRRVAVPFFGRPADFPAGPFVLAASLGVPVLTFYGVSTGPRRYQVRIAPFADRIVLARATRDADLAACVARYAAWLETGCRAHPFNWFNFFPFWERAEHAPIPAQSAAGEFAADHLRSFASADGAAAG